MGDWDTWIRDIINEIKCCTEIENIKHMGDWETSIDELYILNLDYKDSKKKILLSLLGRLGYMNFKRYKSFK